jgi:non-ribosomal peptide synthetase component F
MHHLAHRLDAAASARLQAAARQHRVTLNTLMQAAFGLLLALRSGRANVMFGATMAGRPAALPGVEEMIGLFINSLPVWMQVPAALPISGWLQSLQAQGTELRQYEFTPLADVQAWAGRPGEPLFDALLVFENYPVEASEGLEAAGLTVSRRDGGAQSLSADGNDIAGRRDRDRLGIGRCDVRIGFDAASAKRLPLAADATGRRRHAVGAIGLAVTPPQLQSLAGYTFEPIAERIASRAAQAPSAPAVGCGDEKLDRAGLEAWSKPAGAAAAAAWRTPGERVGLCVERSAGMVAGLLGILKAGAAYVPLDPTYPAERLRLMLDDAAVRCVITDDTCTAAMADVLAGRHLIQLTEVADEAATPPPVTVSAEQLALCDLHLRLDRPSKGVGVSHSALDRFLASMAERPGLPRPMCG